MPAKSSTFFPDDVDAFAGPAERGIDPTRHETYGGGVRKITFRDPPLRQRDRGRRRAGRLTRCVRIDLTPAAVPDRVDSVRFSRTVLTRSRRMCRTERMDARSGSPTCWTSCGRWMSRRWWSAIRSADCSRCAPPTSSPGWFAAVRGLVLEDPALLLGDQVPDPAFVAHQEEFLDRFAAGADAEMARLRLEARWTDDEIVAWAAQAAGRPADDPRRVGSG